MGLTSTYFRRITRKDWLVNSSWEVWAFFTFLIYWALDPEWFGAIYQKEATDRHLHRYDVGHLKFFSHLFKS